METLTDIDETFILYVTKQVHKVHCLNFHYRLK